MQNAIEFCNLSKTYGRGARARIALNALNMTVKEGEVFGFIGPNGAGKSTAIKILVGLVTPSGGRAELFGRPCSDPAARRLVGYLPEIANYQDLLTVDELLTRHASMAMISPADIPGRLLEALELVGLSGRRSSRLRELSKGMLQRFGLAQALVARPSLLILDEPTSGLDPIAQRELKNIILLLKERGTTIFFSSHQLTEIELMCDAVGILHAGHLLACAPLVQLLSDDGKARVRSLEDAYFDLVARSGGAA